MQSRMIPVRASVGLLCAVAAWGTSGAGCKPRTFNSAAKSDRGAAAKDTLGADWRPEGGAKYGFQGMFLTIKPMLIWQCYHSAYEVAKKALSDPNITKMTGTDWAVRPFGSNRYDFIAYPKSPVDLNLSQVKQVEIAFDKAGAALKGNLVDAKGMWRDEKEYGVNDFKKGDAIRGGTTADPDWSIKYTRVDEAWKHLDATDAGRGKGVTIAVIDTGVIEHPIIWPETAKENGGPRWLEAAKQGNFKTKFQGGANRPAFDEPEPNTTGAGVARDFYNTDDGRPANPGHGTAVLGVIIARAEDRLSGARGFVVGVAPDARVIPVRVTPSTVMLDGEPMAKGIEHAVAQGAKVISISIGGAPSVNLRKAIEAAARAGIIVVGAAGNGVPIVVWPAAYSEVIAVGAGTIACTAWSKSSPGPKVEVLAPGSEVWYPATFRDPVSKEIIYSLKRGEGTSFATPFVAGAAALWLARHGGWESVKNHYGDPRYVSLAFRYALNHETGHRTCHGLDTDKHGKGFINVGGLAGADAKLPAKADIDFMFSNPTQSQVRLPEADRLQHLVQAGAEDTLQRAGRWRKSLSHLRAQSRELRVAVLSDVIEALRTPGDDLGGLDSSERKSIIKGVADALEKYIDAIERGAQ